MGPGRFILETLWPFNTYHEIPSGYAVPTDLKAWENERGNLGLKSK